jgi:hypothetical protein
LKIKLTIKDYWNTVNYEVEAKSNEDAVKKSCEHYLKSMNVSESYILKNNEIVEMTVKIGDDLYEYSKLALVKTYLFKQGDYYIENFFKQEADLCEDHTIEKNLVII